MRQRLVRRAHRFHRRPQRHAHRPGGGLRLRLAVIPFTDEDEAVAIANDSRYGLGAGVWTADIGRAFRMAERVHSGTVWVTTYRAVSYLAPFDGVEDSGVGRENGVDPITAHLEDKSVWTNTGASAGNPFVLR